MKLITVKVMMKSDHDFYPEPQDRRYHLALKEGKQYEVKKAFADRMVKEGVATILTAKKAAENEDTKPEPAFSREGSLRGPERGGKSK